MSFKKNENTVSKKKYRKLEMNSNKKWKNGYYVGKSIRY